jgi:hypothetical protein
MVKSVDSSNSDNLLQKVYTAFTGEILQKDKLDDLHNLIDVLPGLQKILDGLRFGIVIISKTYEVIYHNKELLMILDLQGPILGKKWQDVFNNEIPSEIKRVAKEASFNYPTFHNIKISNTNQSFEYLGSFYPINDALLIQLSPKHRILFDSNDFSMDYIHSIGENNPDFVSEILNSFINVVSEDLNKIQVCIKNNNDCGKLALIAQNISSNINLLGREDLVMRWKKFISTGMETIEDRYELILLIKLTESLVDNVKKYNQTSF